MKNTLFNFLPEEMIYTISSNLNYDEIKSTKIIPVVNWRKMSIYKYGTFEDYVSDKVKYSNSKLSEMVINLESKLKHIDVAVEILDNGRFVVQFIYEDKYNLNELKNIEFLLKKISAIEKLTYSGHVGTSSTYLGDQIVSGYMFESVHRGLSKITVHKDTLLYRMLLRNDIIRENK